MADFGHLRDIKVISLLGTLVISKWYHYLALWCSQIDDTDTGSV